MKTRIADLVGESEAKNLWMGTFHSVFARLLRAEADKLRYDQELALYTPPPGHDARGNLIEENRPKKRNKRVPKDPNAPKQARNIYWYYCNEARPKAAKENPDMGLPELSKLISQGYKKLSDKGKEKYQKLADEDKKRFLKEQEAYAAGKSISNSVEKERAKNKS